ncbi:hypothetical protein HYV81_03850 [Candidatus Woesearchaeota archaeon]|nr:hypothetical protein [Candidatus Woesearchaeota archaeon]
MALHNKSQLTIIIIVGILVFAMIIFLLYLILFKAEKKLEKEKIETLDTGLETLREYTNKCIEDVSSKALELVGRQGAIYASQGGLVADPIINGQDYVQFSNSKISYGLRRPVTDIGDLYFWQPPAYPWTEFPYKDADYESIDLEHGYYGTIQLPALLNSNDSVLRQIEHYINNNAASCLTFKEFRQYNVTLGNISTAGIISDNYVKGGIIINAKVPITVYKPTGEEITTMEDFSVPLRIRLRLVYDLARTIIEQESSSIVFSTQSVNYENMEVALTKHVFGNDAVVTITDPRSSLYARPYTFSFTVQNRYPALHAINEQTLPVLEEGDLISSNSSAALIVERDGESIFVSPPVSLNTRPAYDPDEDILNYSYNPPLPYTIGEADVPDYNDKWHLTVTVSDGLLSDYQDLEFQTAKKSKVKKNG